MTHTFLTGPSFVFVIINSASEYLTVFGTFWMLSYILIKYKSNSFRCYWRNYFEQINRRCVNKYSVLCTQIWLPCVCIHSSKTFRSLKRRVYLYCITGLHKRSSPYICKHTPVTLTIPRVHASVFTTRIAYTTLNMVYNFNPVLSDGQ